MLVILISFLCIEGVSMLSCSFDDGLCGWENPENASKIWILNNGISQHIATPYSEPNALPFAVQLVYPNFTGSGFLSFSYCQFGIINLRIKAEEKTIHFLYWRYSSSLIWKSITVPITSINETIVLEASRSNMASSGRIAVDDIVFYKKDAPRCQTLRAPVNGTINCTSSDHHNSICHFECNNDSHMIGSSERRCLPTGVWSGYQPSCKFPQIRLTSPQGNQSTEAGVVELFFDGVWTPVCMSLRSSKQYNNIATVTCRSLGYGNRGFNVPSVPSRTLADSWVLLGNGRGCQGDEKSLSQCKKTDIKRHSCPSDHIFFVSCVAAPCPNNCFCSFKYENHIQKYIVLCGAPDTLDVLKTLPHYTIKLRTVGINMTQLKEDSLRHLPLIDQFIFRKAGIKNFDAVVLKHQKGLNTIDLRENQITSFHDLNFEALKQAKLGDILKLKGSSFSSYLSTQQYSVLLDLDLQDNKIANITKDAMKGKELIRILFLQNNHISFIEDGSFQGVFKLLGLSLAQNRISYLPENFMTKDVIYVDLRYNRIKYISPGSFNRAAPYTFAQLFLGQNLIANITSVFYTLKDLILLDLGGNHIFRIKKDVFKDLKKLGTLSAARTNLYEIEDMAFRNQDYLRDIFLDGNKLTRINKMTFLGAYMLWHVSLSNNPLKVIESGAFKHNRELTMVYLIGTQLQTIDIGMSFVAPQLTISHSPGDVIPEMMIFPPASDFLRSTGYLCDQHGNWYANCRPCAQGEYKLSVVNEYGCRKCPAGGFYQDIVAHVGEIVYGLGCKQCPVGTFVSMKNAPGRIESSCSACPQGTNLKKRAGFRACPCLDNFHRLDRFGICKECPVGYKCTNETVNLQPGFYWIWNQDIEKENYMTFSEKLQDETKDHDLDWKVFNGTLPPAYVCPFTSSCKGGFDANCSHGYEGVLCALCSRGFYQTYSGCSKCPSLLVITLQFTTVLSVLAIITFAIVKDRKANGTKRRSVTDTIFSSFKIVIGFYQVTSGTLRAYSYIQWPTALTGLMKFADVVQLNIFKLVPMECLSHSIKITPYFGLVAYVSVDTLVILLAIGYLSAKKVFLKMKKVSKEETKKNLFTCKANCYRAVFLFLFVTYPATCEKVFQVLPVGCTKVCDNHQRCHWYLRSDYSIQCYTTLYNKYLILAYSALIIPVLFPVVTILLLWKYCRNEDDHEFGQKDRKKSTKVDGVKKPKWNSIRKYFKRNRNEISLGMRFIYENYSQDCWYWEVIELVRKVILTSVLIYSGQSGRFFLAVAATLSGFYAVFFANSKPVPYLFEHWLHLGSLLATMANQSMAILLKIPVESVSSAVNVEDDSYGVSLMLVFANVFVLLMVAVRYFYGIILSLKAFKKNPRCSIECIMTILQVVTIGDGQERPLSTKRDKNRHQTPKYNSNTSK